MAAPSYTDNVTVLAPYAIIKGEAYRVSGASVAGLDLRTKVGAWLKMAIACGGSTALTAGAALYAKVYRCLNADGANEMNGSLFFNGVHTAIGKALINGAVAAGVTSIAYDGAGGTAFAAENTVCIWGTETIPGASGAVSVNHGMEFLNLSKGASTPCLFNTPTKYDHHDNEVITLASAWDIWLPGGSVYALVADHLFDAAGEAMAIAAYLQSFDSY